MRLSLAILMCSVACGSDGIGSGDSLGEGNQVLEVSGSVEASNQINNASDANDFITSFEVRVRRDDTDVGDAVVVVTSDIGTVELQLNSDGEYAGDQVGYSKVYRLDVSAGEDFVHGVRVDGPDVHTFTSPAAGAQVDGRSDLVVEWERDEAAESVVIETDEMDDKLAISDTGSYSIPVAALNWELEEPFNDRIRLERLNRVSPIGAAGDSSFSVRIRNEIDFVAIP